MKTLGIHGGVTSLQNEASASLLIDGRVVSACEEERFMRLKGGFGLLPLKSISQCLKESQLTIKDIDFVVQAGASHADLGERMQS